MSRHGRKAILGLVLMLLSTTGAVVYAAFNDMITITNHVATGDVNIGIEEVEVKDRSFTEYQNQKIIFPGDTISKIPRIVNYAADCWVRAKIISQTDREDLGGITEDMLEGIPASWEKHGEYYYFTKPLHNGKYTELFQAVRIPEDWSEEHADQALTLTIRAEAVQKAHFTPDFTAMSPWGDVPVEYCIHEKDNAVISRQTDLTPMVEYSGDAHKLAAVPEDFFAGFGEWMPGDEKTEQVQIKNTTDTKTELVFFTGYENQNEQQMKLLQNMFLTIRYQDKELYSGTLTAEALREGVSLGLYAPGEEAVMEYTVSLPKTVNNALAKTDAAVKWIFAAKEEEKPFTGGNPDLSPQTRTGSPVKTGDETVFEVYVGILLAAILLIPLLCLIKRRSRR